MMRAQQGLYHHCGRLRGHITIGRVTSGTIVKARPVRVSISLQVGVESGQVGIDGRVLRFVQRNR